MLKAAINDYDGMNQFVCLFISVQINNIYSNVIGTGPATAMQSGVLKHLNLKTCDDLLGWMYVDDGVRSCQ